MSISWAEALHQALRVHSKYSSAATRVQWSQKQAMRPGAREHPDEKAGGGGGKAQGACTQPASRCPLRT